MCSYIVAYMCSAHSLQHQTLSSDLKFIIRYLNASHFKSKLKDAFTSKQIKLFTYELWLDKWLINMTESGFYVTVQFMPSGLRVISGASVIDFKVKAISYKLWILLILYTKNILNNSWLR